MTPQDRLATLVVFCLAVTTVANAAFLLADPRLFALPAWLAAVYLAGGVAYVVSIPLCLRRQRTGFVLATLLGIGGAAVAAADNLSLSGSTPNTATAALNLLVLGFQLPLVAASVSWLRRRPQEWPSRPPPQGGAQGE